MALSATIFSDKFFRRTGLLACSSVFLLFLLGGLVRVTGSGMGCPDWPKCFGLLAPPTCSCELPADYQQIFLEKRIKKLQRFTDFIEKIGLKTHAERIRSDKKLLLPEEFNAFKAWTEYINRLFGVLAGLFGLAFALLALRYRKIKGKITAFALAGLVMLILNAWLGSMVVATNLLPGLVTIHFLLSFLCMFFFMYAVHLQKPFVFSGDKEKWQNHWLILFGLSMLVVIYGTFAREKVEILEVQGMLQKGSMLDLTAMGIDFAIHRFLPGLIFVYLIWLWWTNRQTSISQKRFSFILILVVFDQIALGAVNTVYSLPAVSQVGHIVLGALLPLLLFYALLARVEATES